MWIEALRIDDAHRILGVRLNVWTSLLVFAAGAVSFLLAGRLGRPWAVAAGEGGSKAVGTGSPDGGAGPGEGADGDGAPAAPEGGLRADSADPLEGEALAAADGAGTPEEGTAAVESGAPRADGPGGALTGGNDGEDAGPDRD